MAERLCGLHAEHAVLVERRVKALGGHLVVRACHCCGCDHQSRSSSSSSRRGRPTTTTREEREQPEQRGGAHHAVSAVRRAALYETTTEEALIVADVVFVAVGVGALRTEL